MKFTARQEWILFPLKVVIWFFLLTLPLGVTQQVWNPLIRNELRLTQEFFVGKGHVKVEPLNDPKYPDLDTRVRSLSRDGKPSRWVMIDLRSLSWIPHSIFLSLCFSSFLPWKLRSKMTVIGMPVLHIVTGLMILVAIWIPIDRETAQGTGIRQEAAYQVLIQNLWWSYFIPLVIWISSWILLAERTEFTEGVRTAKFGSPTSP